MYSNSTQTHTSAWTLTHTHTHTGQPETSQTWIGGEGKQWGHCFCCRWGTHVMNMLNAKRYTRGIHLAERNLSVKLNSCLHIDVSTDKCTVQFAALAAFPLKSHDFMSYFIWKDICHNHLHWLCFSLSNLMIFCCSSQHLLCRIHGTKCTHCALNTCTVTSQPTNWPESVWDSTILTVLFCEISQHLLDRHTWPPDAESRWLWWSPDFTSIAMLRLEQCTINRNIIEIAIMAKS